MIQPPFTGIKSDFKPGDHVRSKVLVGWGPKPEDNIPAQSPAVIIEVHGGEFRIAFDPQTTPIKTVAGIDDQGYMDYFWEKL
jgi:hypothetical protein